MDTSGSSAQMASGSASTLAEDEKSAHAAGHARTAAGPPATGLWSVHAILHACRGFGASRPAAEERPLAPCRRPGKKCVKAVGRLSSLVAMPRPTSFGKDTGLQLRMVTVLFLLGVVYVVLVGALLAAGANAGLVAIIAVGLAAFQLFGSDKLALRAMGAREVTPQEAPELHAMIERLCVQADLPKPKIAVADTPMPNAFALGRSPKNSTVCATTGIMQLLSPAELEGVMAHELSHIANRDVMVMTLAGFFATIAAYIVQFGMFFGGGHGDDDDNPSFIVVFFVSLAVYVISFFLMQALSRYREYAADRGAAIVTGRPSALASALVKIDSGMAMIPQARPARLRGAGRLLHLPARRGAEARRAVLDPSPDGEAHRRPRAPGGAAAGHRVGFTASWASSTSSPAGARSSSPRRTGCSP